MKRITLATIAFLLLTSLAFGAGGSEGSAAGAGGPSSLINMDSLIPVTTEMVNPTMITRWQGDQSTPEDQFIFKWLEKVCNIKFDVTPINNADFDAKYNIILNAGDLPDLTAATLSTSVMTQYFSDAGLGFDMWPSILKYAPEMKQYFDNEPDVKDMCSVDGKLLSLCQYRYVGFAGGRNWINHDFLETLGLDMPRTLDEFKATLIAFRDKDPNGNGKADEIGFGGSWEEGYRDWDPIFNAFGWLQPFGSNDQYLQLDTASGKSRISFVPLTESYQDYLAYMNDLWNEGLMDPDIFTQSETASLAKIAEDRVGYAAGGAPYVLLPNDKGPNVDDYKYWYLEPMVSKEGQTPAVPLGNPCIPGYYVISADSEYADVLVRMINLAFTWEYAECFYWGPTYGGPNDTENGLGAVTYADPSNKTTSGGIKYPHKEANYPELTNWQYLLNYVGGQMFKVGLSTYSNSYTPEYAKTLAPPTRENPLYEVYFRNGVLPQDNVNAWSYGMELAKQRYGVPGIPVLYMSADDTARMAELRTSINDAVDQMTAKIITGAEPLSAYDKLVRDLKELGAEEYERIAQKYYDAYYAK